MSHTCLDKKQTLDGLVAVGFYHNPELRALIHGLKYQLATCLVPTIAEVIRRYAHERRDPWPWTGRAYMALQAVSGVPSRTRARGFDQAEVLRDIIQEEIIPWAKPVSLLSRSPGVSPQAELEVGPLRQANIRDSFSLTSSSQEVLPQTVILVDDVFTTGATMHEAARILKQAGVHSVYGFVLALGK